MQGSRPPQNPFVAGKQVVPILRAGLVPLEHASTVLPAMQTYHVGLIRDEKTLQVSGEQRDPAASSQLVVPADCPCCRCRACLTENLCAAADRVPE